MKHQTLDDILRDFVGGGDALKPDWLDIDATKQAINAKFEAAIGEDEDVRPEITEWIVSGSREVAEAKNQARAEARRRWYK